MNTSGNIEKKVEATLSSIDRIQRATANPFLFTRIMASLNAEEDNLWSRGLKFVSNPVFAIAAILLVVMMNFLVIFESSDNTQIAAQEGEQLFAAEYNYSTTTSTEGLYIVNDEQP